ncbi:alanine racemase [Venenivibrio stagnispumantis]|uniref:Alanine racemase n=1 Tax=Venenivibrio stagnispumantis TaxID=407998 RepID=A0AA45WLS1_9AQUI|nr:alanine racemase [Venenivibrio stagnispumantis]MCW4573436.1 alanine racemase [Venenivibrio stagnispumantis]SMP11961.1 alanine racemase [Venenivibrio stagnispumantis]
MFLHRSIAEINLENLKKNITNIYNYAKKEIIAVIKADAYGHGAVNIGRFLDKIDFVKYLAVATAEEGKELREANIKKPIIVLGGILKEEIDIFNNFNLVPVISNFYQLEQVKSLKNRNIHLKFDTGMHRLGFYKEDIEKINKLIFDNCINIEGVMSHFPSADIDKEFTENQIKIFQEIINQLKAKNLKYIHIQNSAGIIYNCDFCNLIRIGLAMYGEKPIKDYPVELNQVMQVKAKIISIKDIKKGEGISYCHTFKADKDMKIAVISFGYADGLPRALSNKGEVIINNNKAKIIGNITMDMSIIDITDIDAVIGDEAIIIGSAGNQKITFTDIANLTNTIPYEIMCGISKRVYREIITE